MDRRAFAQMVFRHKRTVAAFMVLVLAAVAAVTFLVPPIYRAEASLLVKFGRENIYRSEVGATNVVANINQDQIIGSQVQILKSPDLHARVLDELGVENLYPKIAADPPARMTVLEAAMEAFAEDLDVEAARGGSTVIELRYENGDPKVAAMTLNRLLDDFKAKHLALYSDPKSGFLEAQLVNFERQLHTAQEQLAGFRQQRKVFDLPEQRQLLLRQRTDLDTNLKAASKDVEELGHKLATLTRQRDATPDTIPLYTETERYSIVDQAKATLLELQLREQQLLSKYNERSQLIADVRDEIHRVRGFIKDLNTSEVQKSFRSGANEVFLGVQKDILGTEAALTAANSRRDVLRAQIAHLDGQIEGLVDNEQTLRDLERAVDVAETNYRAYRAKVEEARISERMDENKMASVGVIQPALIPPIPRHPRPLLYFAAALLVGLLGGIGLAVFAEYSSSVLATPAAVERRLGVPVLSTFDRQADA